VLSYSFGLMSPAKPEEAARKEIDAALEAAGWVIQDDAEMNLCAAQGVAVCEFLMTPGQLLALREPEGSGRVGSQANRAPSTRQGKMVGGT
jgi:hypothetical protein